MHVVVEDGDVSRNAWVPTSALCVYQPERSVATDATELAAGPSSLELTPTSSTLTNLSPTLTPRVQRDIEEQERLTSPLVKHTEPGWSKDKQRRTVINIMQEMQGASPEVKRQMLMSAYARVCEGPSLELTAGVFAAAQEHARVLKRSLACTQDKKRMRTALIMATAPCKGLVREYSEYMDGIDRRTVYSVLEHRDTTDVADSTDYFRVVHKGTETYCTVPLAVEDDAARFWLLEAEVRNMGSGRCLV
jgi:hypothetical protein